MAGDFIGSYLGYITVWDNAKVCKISLACLLVLFGRKDAIAAKFVVWNPNTADSCKKIHKGELRM